MIPPGALLSSLMAADIDAVGVTLFASVLNIILKGRTVAESIVKKIRWQYPTVSYLQKSSL
jgi:hypothetical protein